MRSRNVAALFALAVTVISSCSRPAPPVAPMTQGATQVEADLIRVAIVTGGHAFDVPKFYQLFRDLPGIDPYPQHMEHFASSSEEIRDSYDAVVFYGMERGEVPEEGPHYAGNTKAALERIVEQGQGIVILHHALLAWEKWDRWDQVIGHDERNFRWKPDLDLHVEVSDKQHPIMRGMSDFDTVDEGYVLHGKHDGQSTVLLTAEHKDIMREVAWAREIDDCRVFVLALGDNPDAWRNAGFREILGRGILWAAGE